ncbi:hypothetical protein H0H92_003802 [Tricholoma furcatifolium]|nr:hypothetical protein H0H92_003802 [Tricholoma furcatifolium]
MTRPIVIVTGANGGVGFGICQRLLFQLCHASPSDALPQSFAVNNNASDPVIYDGLTLIMACRSVKRAEVARTKLLGLLDSYIETLQRTPKYDGHAHTFRKNLVVDIVPIDLAMISTVFKFANEVTNKYPYISHLIMNAGVASFIAIDWIKAVKQILKEPVNAITAPEFYTQNRGELSVDGLGWVWQSNLFSHYVLVDQYRSIQHLLLASPPCLGARAVWSSSLEASPAYFDPEDWQNKSTEHSYEATKYQIDLISTRLDQLSLQRPASRRIRHFITHPGVCSTNVANALIGPVLDMCKLLAFYIVRFLGSPNHPIDPFKAAIAAVHVSLASLTFLTLFNDQETKTTRPSKFGAETDRWANERVGVTDVKNWDQNGAESDALLSKLDDLYQSFKKAEEVTINVETASEHM